MGRAIPAIDFLSAIEAIGWLDSRIETSRVSSDRVTVTKRVRLPDGSIVEVSKNHTKEGDKGKDCEYMVRVEEKTGPNTSNTSFFPMKVGDDIPVTAPIKKVLELFLEKKDAYLLLQMKMNKIQDFQRTLFSEEKAREKYFLEAGQPRHATA